MSAGSTGTPLTTSVIPPGARTRATVKAGTCFHLRISHRSSGAVFGTTLDSTHTSGRRVVRTRGSFNTFGYGKLPC
ncbi:hypothetical protein [Saccharothrix yanglingensis]|uniref:Uncharacterized protein n=1 Tax=Saccharothrix yanglingensis TaxID=659496 RepID=A0ABU0X7K1_9PSEU|nr:hypothetical protein [Saccharothrix yanglingensis]MDQ2588100.1 hypothetical protein [Saccharothrix yanglingensis]